MAILMKATEYAKKLRDIALNYKTLYVMGCIGSPLNVANKKRYINHHVYNQSAVRQRMINAATDDTFGFDCVCLLKSVLWGWSGDKSKTYGGAIYATNGVPDVSADGMIRLCKDVSTDFSNLLIGEALWCRGHIGLYIGDGLAVECTPKWKNCVQITAVGNIGTKAGYNARRWTKRGKLPYIEYDAKAEPVVPPRTSTASSSTSGGYAVGKDNEETCYNFFTQVMKLNVAASCGILSNIKSESGFNPKALGDNGTSYGICQWHKTRWTRLKDWCSKNKKDDTTLDGQLWFLKYELEVHYKTVYSTIKAVPNTEQGAYNAAYNWCVKYEVPANKETVGANRGEYAKTLFQKYSGGTTSSGSSVQQTSSNVEPAQKYDKAIAGRYKVNARFGLHIRAGAGTTKKSLGVLPYNTVVNNYGFYTVATNGTKWYYVLTSDGQLGYCSSRYLKKA